MIVDLRVYTYVPSKYRTFLKGYEEVGFNLTSKHLGKTLGIFRPESGIQNRTFQFFMYEDSPHRDACRRGMLVDPAWAEFVKIDSDALLQQTNTLLIPTSFSPIGGATDAQVALVASAGERLFELRCWRCKPGDSPDVLTDLQAGGADLLTRHMPYVIAWFTADTGDDHRVFRLTAFADAADRDRARAAARADDAVDRFTRNMRARVVEEDAQLLLPMSYSPLR